MQSEEPVFPKDSGSPFAFLLRKKMLSSDSSASLNKTNKDLALYFVALKCTPVRFLVINVSAEVGSYLFLGLVVSELQ